MKRDLVHRIYALLRKTWVRNALDRSLVEIERFQRPTAVERPPGGRVLVLAPHPDDETIGCGGTLRKYVEANLPVRVIFLTDGQAGDPPLRRMDHDDPERLRLEEALAARRKEEATAALAILGIDDFRFLGASDGRLHEQSTRMSALLADALSEFRPDIVVLPFLTDRHADHFAANRCLIEAADRLHGDWLESLDCLGYETWSPIYANLYVDITSTMACKRRALTCHESQLQHNDYLSAVEGLNRYRAISGMSGGTHAEAFFLAPLKIYRSLYRNLLL